VVSNPRSPEQDSSGDYFFGEMDMRKIVLTASCLLALIAPAHVMAQDTYVQGYTTGNGTYVQPHFRSQADSYQNNNFSARGNTNPYTGSTGSDRPPSLNPGQGENNYQPSSNGYNQQQDWNNNRPQGSSYRRPQSGM
jgi:hypothetical protein